MPAGVDEGFCLCTFILIEALFLNLYQSTDSKALHDAGIRPNPGRKKKEKKKSGMGEKLFKHSIIKRNKITIMQEFQVTA